MTQHRRNAEGNRDRDPLVSGPAARKALRFVVLIGIVSLFGDMTYEAARGVNGSYLAVLGASAAAVGIVSGAAELLGYGVRVISGVLSGRSGRYWWWVGVGYAVNLLAVPALALADRWPLAAGLIVLERVGKGLRNPPRDAMLSFAGSVIGHGWAFALREGLDQAGAMLGPLLMGVILLQKQGDFRIAYLWLLVPALLSLLVLAISRWLFPSPRALESTAAKKDRSGSEGAALPSAFWTYLVAMAFIAVGYADFNLVAYHLQVSGTATGVIPLLYVVAMGTAGLAALIVGRRLDRYGMRALVVASAAATVFAPLTFLGTVPVAAVGVALWGVGMGIQDSIMSAPISMITEPDGRSRALGIFNALYGVAWFAGSTLLGVVYGYSVGAVVVISIAAQAVGVAVLIRLGRSWSRPLRRPRDHGQHGQ